MKGLSSLSLTTRLIISHLLVGLLSVSLTYSLAANFILQGGQRDVAHNIQDLAYYLSNGLEAPFINYQQSGTSGDELKSTIDEFLNKHPTVNFTIFLPDGKIFLSNESVAPSPATAENAPEVFQAVKNPEGEATRPGPDGQDTLYVATPIMKEGQLYGILRLATPIKPAMADAYRSLTLLLIISGLVLVAVVLEGWWLAMTLTRPIRALTQVAERLSRGDLKARSEPTGPAELLQLSDTFNQMAALQQDNVENMQAFVANASHELRTPLTAIKLHVGALRDGALEDPEVSQHFLQQIEEEIERLIRMVNDLLDLNRIEANRGNQAFTLVDLMPLATETRDFWRVRAQQAQLDLRLTLPQNLPPINGNEDQLRRLLNNLLENAIKNTRPGGWVELSIVPGPRSQTVRIEVRDNGIGIPEEHLPHIFERFYRVEATRPRHGRSNSSGLGLAIARSIVEAHGGKIGVTSQIGVGTTFYIDLPAFWKRRAGSLSPSTRELKS